jgi:hypothetical protein
VVDMLLASPDFLYGLLVMNILESPALEAEESASYVELQHKSLQVACILVGYLLDIFNLGSKLEANPRWKALVPALLVVNWKIAIGTLSTPNDSLSHLLQKFEDLLEEEDLNLHLYRNLLGIFHLDQSIRKESARTLQHELFGKVSADLYQDLELKSWSSFFCSVDPSSSHNTIKSSAFTHDDVRKLASIIGRNADMKLRMTAMKQLQHVLMSDLLLLYTCDSKWSLDFISSLLKRAESSLSSDASEEIIMIVELVSFMLSSSRELRSKLASFDNLSVDLIVVPLLRILFADFCASDDLSAKLRVKLLNLLSILVQGSELFVGDDNIPSCFRCSKRQNSSSSSSRDAIVIQSYLSAAFGHVAPVRAASTNKVLGMDESNNLSFELSLVDISYASPEDDLLQSSLSQKKIGILMFLSSHSVAQGINQLQVHFCAKIRSATCHRDMNEVLSSMLILLKSSSSMPSINAVLDAVLQESRIQRIMNLAPKSEEDCQTFALVLDILSFAKPASIAHLLLDAMTNPLFELFRSYLSHHVDIKQANQLNEHSIAFVLERLLRLSLQFLSKTTSLEEKHPSLQLRAWIKELSRIACLERAATHIRSLCLQMLLRLDIPSLLTTSSDDDQDEVEEQKLSHDLLRNVKLLRAPDSFRCSSATVAGLQFIHRLISQQKLVKDDSLDAAWIGRLLYDRRADVKLLAVQMLKTSLVHHHCHDGSSTPTWILEILEQSFRMIADHSESLLLRIYLMDVIALAATLMKEVASSSSILQRLVAHATDILDDLLAMQVVSCNWFAISSFSSTIHDLLQRSLTSSEEQEGTSIVDIASKLTLFAKLSEIFRPDFPLKLQRMRVSAVMLPSADQPEMHWMDLDVRQPSRNSQLRQPWLSARIIAEEDVHRYCAYTSLLRVFLTLRPSLFTSLITSTSIAVDHFTLLLLMPLHTSNQSRLMIHYHHIALVFLQAVIQHEGSCGGSERRSLRFLINQEPQRVSATLAALTSLLRSYVIPMAAADASAVSLGVSILQLIGSMTALQDWRRHLLTDLDTLSDLISALMLWRQRSTGIEHRIIFCLALLMQCDGVIQDIVTSLDSSCIELMRSQLQTIHMILTQPIDKNSEDSRVAASHALRTLKKKNEQQLLASPSSSPVKRKASSSSSATNPPSSPDSVAMLSPPRNKPTSSSATSSSAKQKNIWRSKVRSYKISPAAPASSSVDKQPNKSTASASYGSINNTICRERLLTAFYYLKSFFDNNPKVRTRSLVAARRSNHSSTSFTVQ